MMPPEPPRHPVAGHLPEWGRDPLAVLRQGAQLGEIFSLRLWRKTVVGYSPEWNKLVLSDLETFRSRGSLSAVVPYLAGGVVLTDAPEHRGRREELNPHFHSGAVAAWQEPVRQALESALPAGDFEAREFAARAVVAALATVFFSGRIPEAELMRFLAPLEGRFPAALLPRPLAFRRLEAKIAREMALRKRDSSFSDLAAHIAPLDNATEEIRIALAAGFDTTAHTLAWATWHLAELPDPADPTQREWLLQEVLRQYPPGFLGSRISTRAFAFGPYQIPAGSLILYSPYLTHHDPNLWPEPDQFRPARFETRPPAWGYLPFGAGERICLGMPLARLIIREALALLARRGLRQVSGDPAPATGLTLVPRGPLRLSVL